MHTSSPRTRYATRRWLAVGTLAMLATGCVSAKEPATTGWSVVDDAPSDNSHVGDDPVQHDDPVVTDDPVVVDDPAAVDEPLMSLDCTLENYQFQESWWVERYFSSFTPNEGLFICGDGLNGRSTSLSVLDGKPFQGQNLGGLRAVDGSWARAAVVNSDGYPEVRDLHTGELLASTQQWVENIGMSHDGNTVALLRCGQDLTLLDLMDVDSGTTRTIEIAEGEACWGWSPSADRVSFTFDDQYVVFGTMVGTVWAIDVATGAATSVLPHGPLDDSSWEPRLADVTIRPGSRNVVTTGRDGTLREWALPGFSKVGEDISVGAFTINENTYAPRYLSSPVAFTPDGRTMAYVNATGQVTITNDLGSVVLETPPLPEELAEWTQEMPNVPVSMAFGPSGTRLGVGYYFGLATFGCPGEVVQRGGDLVLDVPTTVRLDENGMATINIQPSSPIAGLRALLDGEEARYDGFHNGTFYVQAGSPPTVAEVTIEADDGYARAQATVQLIPAP